MEPQAQRHIKTEGLSKLKKSTYDVTAIICVKYMYNYPNICKVASNEIIASSDKQGLIWLLSTPLTLWN